MDIKPSPTKVRAPMLKRAPALSYTTRLAKIELAPTAMRLSDFALIFQKSTRLPAPILVAQ
jgi:hypothetical protein